MLFNSEQITRDGSEGLQFNSANSVSFIIYFQL
jgi:hypothetical protein